MSWGVGEGGGGKEEQRGEEGLLYDLLVHQLAQTLHELLQLVVGAAGVVAGHDQVVEALDQRQPRRRVLFQIVCRLAEAVGLAGREATKEL